MKPKNVVIFKLYKICNHEGYTSRLYESDYEFYAKMTDLAVNSVKKYIKDVDEVIVDTGTVSHEQEMFKDHMIKLYTFHKNNNCNILYMDSDNLVYDQCDIFNKFTKFTMTGSNCGVRYYPNNIDDVVWKTMFDLYERWPDYRNTNDNDYQNWSYEQDIYKHMLASQYRGNHVINNSHMSIENEDFQDILCVAQAPSIKCGYHLNEHHKIAHFHSSNNGPKESYELMKKASELDTLEARSFIAKFLKG